MAKRRKFKQKWLIGTLALTALGHSFHPYWESADISIEIKLEKEVRPVTSPAVPRTNTPALMRGDAS